jgi:hypothetical protein
MKTETYLAYFLIIFAILISIWPILRTIRFGFWQQKPFEEKKAKTPKPLKPKTPDDCAICRGEKASPPKGVQIRQLPCPWNEVRNRRGRKKTLSTQGYACNNRKCGYFHIMDESIHAVVGYGCHGKNERIQDLMCQACGKKFTVRRDTVLYRLKSHSEKVALVETMRPGCLPIFTTDGLKLYFYALTAHFGQWKKSDDGCKLVWIVASELIYGQVKKIVRRRRLVRVEHTMGLGEQQNLKDRLLSLGFSGRINTAFIERLNLTIRQGVSLLVRRTWGRAKFSPELKLHLLWWRSYYHFARYHASLRVEFSQPTGRKGHQIPCRYRSRTPATPALHRMQ